jgi:hypothetical protein
MPDQGQNSLRIFAWMSAVGALVSAAMFLAIAAAQLATILGQASVDLEGVAAWLTGYEFMIWVALVSLVEVILFLIWLYRATANLSLLNPAMMPYRPWVVVVLCLIPAAGLIFQFFVMRAIWRATLHRPDIAPLFVSLWAASAFAPALASLIPVILAWDIRAVDDHYEIAANIAQALNFLLQATLVLRLTGQQRRMTPISDVFA